MTGEEFAKGHLNDYLVEDEKAVEALQDGDLGESRSVGEASAAELRNGAMHVSSGKELPKEVDWVHTKSTGRVYKQVFLAFGPGFMVTGSDCACDCRVCVLPATHLLQMKLLKLNTSSRQASWSRHHARHLQGAHTRDLLMRQVS